MNQFETSRGGVEQSEISQEMLTQARIEVEKRDAKGKTMGKLLGPTFSILKKSSEGMPPSAQSAAYAQLERSIGNLAEFSNERLTREQMIAKLEQIFTTKDKDGNTKQKISLLPKDSTAKLLRKEGQAKVLIDGEIYIDKRADEVATMLQIKRRLARSKNPPTRVRPREQLYIQPVEDTLVINRLLLEKDLRWLEDDKRIGPDVPAERKAYFVAYRNMLIDLVRLNPRDDELSFRKTNGTILTPQRLLSEFSKDPNSIKNAGKFGLFILMSGLLVLWSLKDYKKGSISPMTLALVGGIFYLSQTGSKLEFLKHNEFRDAVARGGLDGKAIDALAGLAKNKPAAYAHLMTTLKNYSTTGLKQDQLHYLTDPKQKRNGQEVSDPTRKVPEGIAKLFINRKGAHNTVLNGIKKNAKNPQALDMIKRFADAVTDRGGTVQDELQSFLS